jgi:glycosyltransferase involved in cell wall biosynthesis
VIPGGVTALMAAGRLPLVVSLHGSDVYVAERHALVGRLARTVFERAAWVTACSDDLAARAVTLGASPSRMETLPYGVDAARFAPRPDERARLRRELGIEGPFVFSAGRLVGKKGFAFLIDAAARLKPEWPTLRVAIAGEGDLHADLAARAVLTGGTVVLLGNRSQDDVARLAAAADVVAVPSIHDDDGNVDGLPNFALEALASGTPVVASRVGGLPSAIEDGVTGRLVQERDATALADALAGLLRNPGLGRVLGTAARAHVVQAFGWDRYAERLITAYDRASGGRR